MNFLVLLIHIPYMERGKLNQFVMFSKEMIVWFSDLACLVLFESLQWPTEFRKTLIKGLLRVLLQLTIIHATLSKISVTRKSYQKSFLFEFPANKIKVCMQYLSQICTSFQQNIIWTGNNSFGTITDTKESQRGNTFIEDKRATNSKINHNWLISDLTEHSNF